MDAILSHDGDMIDYTPTSAVASGAVILFGFLICVASRPIPANTLGALATEGVFNLAKDATSGPVFAVGDEVHWDFATSQAVHPQAGSYPVGIAEAAAGTSDATVRVRLVQQRNSQLDGLIRESVDLTSADKTLDIQDVGKRLVVSNGGTNVVILPSTAAGLRFVIEAAADGARVAVSPAAADKIMGADLAGTDNKDRILTAATAKKGDYIILSYGGADGWLVNSERGTWAAEA